MNRFCVIFIFLSFLSSAQVTPLSIDDFIADATMIDANLSPDGSKIATVWNIEDKRYVIVLRTSDNKVLGRFGDNINRPFAVTWANAERLLVKLQIPFDTDRVRRDAETQDDFDINDYFLFIRVVSTDIYGGNLVQLVNNDRAARATYSLANIPHYLPNDKEHILMATWRNSRFALLKVNVYTGISERVAIGTKKTVGFIVDEYGNLSFRYDYDSYREKLTIFEYKNDQEWSEIEEIYFNEDDGKNKNVELDDLVGLYDGNLIFLQRNPITGFNEILKAEPGVEKKSILASLPNIEIVGVLKNSAIGDVIGYQSLDNVYRSFYFDPIKQSYYDNAAKYFDHQNFYFSSFSANYEKAIIVAFGANNPSTYYLYDSKQSSLKLLNYPYPRLKVPLLASGKIITYQTRDNVEITAYLLLPPEYNSNKQYPLILMPHGGPQARDYLGYDDFAQLIASQGYIVVKPNFRGSTGYGKTFEEAGYKEWGGVMQDDLEDAVSFLVKQKYVAQNNVCIVGQSYGGYAALMGVVKTPSLYNCAVSINGVSHLPDQVEHMLKRFQSEKGQTFIHNTIGHPKRDEVILEANSPALIAKNILAPILMIAGEDDRVVPYEQSKKMRSALRKAKKKFDMLVLDDTGHNVFANKESTEKVYKEVLTFLSINLPIDVSNKPD